MCFLSTLAGSIKIALLISLDDHGENLAIEFELGFHPFILCADDGGFCCVGVVTFVPAAGAT